MESSAEPNCETTVSFRAFIASGRLILIVATFPFISVSTYEKSRGSVQFANHSGSWNPAELAYEFAISTASSIPILLAISNGPLAHLNPTLAPRSTSSIEQISSLTICAETAKVCPNNRSLMMIAASSPHSISSPISHISPASTMALKFAAPVYRGQSSCSAK